MIKNDSDSHLTSEELLTTEEVADLLKTSKASIDNLCSRRKLTYFKLTKKRLFKKSTVMREVMSHRVDAFDLKAV